MALTFRNVECAHCHGYSEDRLLPWLQGVSCRGLDATSGSSAEGGTPAAESSSDGESSYLNDIVAAIQSGKCKYIYRPPENTQTQPRNCLPQVPLDQLHPNNATAVDDNVTNADDECTFEDMLLCKAYSYQTFSSDNEEVKNPHCLKCMTGSSPVSVDLPCARAQNKSWEEGGGSDGQGGILALFSRDSSGGNSIVVNGRTIPASGILCKDDQVFDYVFLVCRTLFCPAGYRPIRGQCSLVDHYMVPAKSQMIPRDLVHDSNVTEISGDLFVERSDGSLALFYPLTNTIFRSVLTKSNTSNQTVSSAYISMLCVQPRMNSTLDCPSVAFDISRTRVENGTLFITDTDLSYPESQYEIHERFALVCSDFENLNDYQFFHFSSAQYYLSCACSLTSVLSLMASLVAFTLLPYLRTLAGHMTASLAGSLAAGQLLILVDFVRHRVVCSVLAAICHFCWLAAFTWMTALAVHMTRTFFGSMATKSGKLNANEVRKEYRKYSLGGWGVPALLVVSLVVLDSVPGTPFEVGYGTPLCGWMRQSYVFLIPVAVALAFNVVCFLLTLISIERTMRASRAALTRQQTSDRQRLVVYTKMMSAMGFTWAAGFLASYTKLAAFWWVYIVLNGLQGTFIAFSFVLNSRLLRVLKAGWSARNAGSSVGGRASGTCGELQHSRVSKLVSDRGPPTTRSAGTGMSCLAAFPSGNSLSGVTSRDLSHDSEQGVGVSMSRATTRTELDN
ncbi:uncharacterized protein LOC143289282 [Babylonia areolata]|uniref:uncharacterized protein LOC143289282 n=1 Tax=Babylonia areolata TaxID=304850 RepID=UPI003FD60480